MLAFLPGLGQMRQTRDLALVVLVAMLGLGGCASSGADDVTVSIDFESLLPEGDVERPNPVPVRVTDIRQQAHLERTALGVHLGNIVVSPPVPDVVQRIVQTTADRVFVSADAPGEPILTGIRVFEIATPSTPLYWDVVAEVELVVRLREEDRTVSGRAEERTYVWPSEKLISEVTHKALQRVVVQLKTVLTELAGKASGQD